MEPPTEREIELMKDLRCNVRDLKLGKELMEDKFLVRWLRARNLKIKDAEVMLRKHVEWYDEQDIKSLKYWVPPAPFEEAFPWSITGVAHNGNIVLSVPAGTFDFVGMVGEGYKEDMIMYAMQLMDLANRGCIKNSQDRDSALQVVGICDLQGLSFRTVTNMEVVETVLTVIKYFEANFPEIIGTVIILNEPWVFSLFWKLAKNFVSEHTYKKLQFLGNNKQRWREVLLQYMDEDQFLEEYGGTAPPSTNITVNAEGELSIFTNGNTKL